MQRRSFVAALAGLGMAQTGAPDAWIDVSPEKAGAEISKHLYGHFIEHLGAVIYDGIWVGPDSRIPNTGGIRTQFIEDMKRISAPNLRWPGGCFADGYHWRDGIGAPEKRPRTYNYWQHSMPAGLDHTETNRFGIHEFMRLCRLIRADPYIAANVGSGSPREFHDWVLYCNAPAGTVSLAAERAANGDKQPFGVSWWGVGNESWGCGGDMKPPEYAALYRRFVTQFPVYPPRPRLVATGPRAHSRDMDLGWTSGFFEAMREHRSPVNGFSLHFYSDFRNGKGRAAAFDPAGWYAVIREGMRTAEVIGKHWEVMSRFDPRHRTKLVVDEWGVWYSPGDEIAPRAILSQPLTLRDALHTAVTFDAFHRHADKVAMACVAQTVNCIHSLFLADGEKWLRTPVYSVFEMYRPHMGARSVPLIIRVDEIAAPADGASVRMPGLSGSASLRDKTLTVTLTNPSLDARKKARVRVTGGTIAEGRGQVLTHENMHAHNSFDRPNEVRLAPLPVELRGGNAEVVLPRQAVAALEFHLS
ncbi:MAG: alpha-N-arabinofuranosidase [Bryobacterales bacterium]|nr:alpha-N-arabinofuranosidase [Bryobacterales bacterium]